MGYSVSSRIAMALFSAMALFFHFGSSQ